MTMLTPMNRRRLLLLLRIVCGVLLLWWAWRQVDAPMREVLSTIQLDWAWLLPGIVLGGLAVVGWGMRWHLFLRLCGLEQPMGETLRITLFADFFNFYFLGPLGADGVRVFMLLRRFPEKKVRIVASIILDHASGFVGGALLYFIFTRPNSGWLMTHAKVVPYSALITADVVLGGISLATIAGAAVLCEPKFWNFATNRLHLGWSLRPLAPLRFLQGTEDGADPRPGDVGADSLLHVRHVLDGRRRGASGAQIRRSAGRDACRGHGLRAAHHRQRSRREGDGVRRVARTAPGAGKSGCARDVTAGLRTDGCLGIGRWHLARPASLAEPAGGGGGTDGCLKRQR